MEYDYQCIYQFYCDIIHKQGVDKIPEELEFLLRMYCRGSIAMTVEWATTGMKMSPEQLADQLIDAMLQSYMICSKIYKDNKMLHF